MISIIRVGGVPFETAWRVVGLVASHEIDKLEITETLDRFGDPVSIAYTRCQSRSAFVLQRRVSRGTVRTLS